jgi:MFS family permease
MFMLIIWLQGIWLPQHGYGFTETPLWAGIVMLPLTIGMLLPGPTSGLLSDRSAPHRSPRVREPHEKNVAGGDPGR